MRRLDEQLTTDGVSESMRTLFLDMTREACPPGHMLYMTGPAHGIFYKVACDESGALYASRMEPTFDQ